MADAVLNLLGDKQLAAVFAGLPAKVQKAVERKSIRVASKIVLTALKQAAPVYSGPALKHVIPGLIRDSIKVRALKRKPTRLGVRVFEDTRREAAKRGLDLGKGYYPASYEYGTPSQPPRPWMKQTAAQVEPQVKALFAADLKQRLTEIANETRAKPAA